MTLGLLGVLLGLLRSLLGRLLGLLLGRLGLPGPVGLLGLLRLGFVGLRLLQPSRPEHSASKACVCLEVGCLKSGYEPIPTPSLLGLPALLALLAMLAPLALRAVLAVLALGASRLSRASRASRAVGLV